MKKLLFFCFLALFIFFSACEKQELISDLNVRVINESGQTLDNVIISEFDFGKIRQNKTTKYKSLERIPLVDGSPVISGKIGKEEYGIYMYCGNSIFSEITEGRYTIRAYFYNESLYFSLEDDELM